MTNTIELRSASPTETDRLGRCLAEVVRPGDVISLEGDLGAGKTRLVQGVARALGAAERVTSPTFGLLAVHDARVPLVHFDLYRLEHEDELEDVDFWGMLEAGGVSFIEWGDRFPSALPPDHLAVTITISSEMARRFEVVGHGQRAAELAAAWRTACERDVASRSAGGDRS